MAEYNLLSLSDQTPMSVTADNYNMLAGEESWSDSAYKAITLGSKGAAYSAINSFLDTGRTVGNWFGADFEMSDTYTELLDTDPEAAQYYRDNKEAVDLAGFLVGSIIPGSAGLKVFNMARGVGSGERFSRTLNLFSAPRDRAFTAAIEAVKGGVPTIDATLRANKLKAISLGFGDQVLQAAVWETAVAATMGASPVLENADWKDMSLNILLGAGVGGAVGGIFDAFGMVGKFNKARAIADFQLRPYEGLTNLGKGDYLGGDRVVALINSLDSIPLPAPAGAATEKATKAFSNAMLESRKILVGMSDDPEVANGLFDAIYKMKFEGGMSNDDLYDYLAAAVKIERIGKDSHLEPLRFEKTLKDPSIIADNKTSWEIVDPNTPLRVGRQATSEEAFNLGGANAAGVYANKTAAFKAGEDVFMDGEGLLHINPNARGLRRVAKPGAVGLKTVKEGPAAGQPAQVNLVVNLRTGAVSDTAMATVGDIAKSADIKLKDGMKSLLVGDQLFAYNIAQGAGKADVMGDDYLRAHARFVWAAERGVVKGDVVATDDIAMMDALLRKIQTTPTDKMEKAFQDIAILTPEGQKLKILDIGETAASDIAVMIEDTKRLMAIDLATKPGMTADEMALRLNVSKTHVQNGFKKSQSIDDISPDAAGYKTPTYARVIYDVGDPAVGIDGMIARGSIGVQARITRAKDAAATVFAKFAGSDSSLFPEIDPRFSQETANQAGAGPSFLGFTNSEYGSIGEMYEAVGTGTKIMIDNRIKQVEDVLAADFINIAAQPNSAAQLGLITNILRASPEHYKLVTKVSGGQEYRYLMLESIADSHEALTLQAGNRLGFVEESKKLLPEGYTLQAAGVNAAEGLAKGKYAAYRIDDDTVWNWFQKNVQINDARLAHHNNMMAAQGVGKELKGGRVYAPPIDTRKYKFIAFVREPAGNGAASSSTAALTATSESELSALITQARSKGYDVITYNKNDIKKWHEAKGDYDYNMNLTENSVDSSLKREGILSNYFPEVQAERVLDDWMSWHRNQVSRQVRNAVELKYGQQFAELRALGEEFTALATSKTGNISTFLKDVAANPYNDYIKTALNLSKASEYRLWMDANEKVEAFFDTAFNTVRNLFPQAASGKISWEEVNKAGEKFGLGKIFVNAANYMESQKILPPTPHLRNFIQGANGVLAATTLRLDFFNSLINIVSTPVLLGTEVQSLRKKIKDMATAQKFEAGLRMPFPGLQGAEIPATSKLIYNAVQEYFSPNAPQLISSYRTAGILPDLLTQHRNMMDELSFVPGAAESELKKKLSAAVEKGSALTGNRFAEQFTRFVSANVMDQLTRAAGVTGAEATAYIRTFVNRVQGNYIAAQRPVVFQGVLGQAMGLFQTYQFNLMQQLFRHVSNGDGKTVATLLGLQSSLFGFQGLPLFAAVNTHIIGNAAGNPTHTDAYTALPRMVGKDLGDLLLYGGVSWASGTAAYTRGDINPRNISILPINPADWPAISGLSRFVSNIINVGQKLGDGGSFQETMLQGLEHNSVSRPLAGFAQVVQGYSTTSQGSLISATMEEGLVATAARLAGSKPLQTAIALDALYRNTAYQAKDVARKKQLGEAVKSAFVGGRSPTEDEINDFAEKYAASGGDIKKFNAFMIDAAKNANTSVVNQFAQNVNNPRARNMMEVMGGEPLTDFSNMVPQSGQRPQDGYITETGVPSDQE